MLSRLSATQKGLILDLVPVVFELIFVAVIYFILNRAADSFTKMHTCREASIPLHKNGHSFARLLLILSDIQFVNPQESVLDLDPVLAVFITDKSWKGFNLSQNPEFRPAMEQGRKL